MIPYTPKTNKQKKSCLKSSSLFQHSTNYVFKLTKTATAQKINLSFKVAVPFKLQK